MEDLKEVVDAAAYRVHRRWKRWASIDDLSQELWMWIYGRGKKKIADLKTVTEETEDLERELMLWFTGIAERYARKEKAQRAGYKIQDEQFYDTGHLEQLLLMCFEKELPDGLEQKSEENRRISRPAEGNELITILVDVRQALKYLTDQNLELLKDYYYFGQTDQTIAATLGISEDAAWRKRHRALRQLRRALGGRRPYRP